LVPLALIAKIGATYRRLHPRHPEDPRASRRREVTREQVAAFEAERRAAWSAAQRQKDAQDLADGTRLAWSEIS